MKTYLFRAALMLSLLLGVGSGVTVEAETSDTLFVTLKNGKKYAFPPACQPQLTQNSQNLYVTVAGGQEFAYPLADIATSGFSSMALPGFKSFKFNNKFNDEVFEDVIATINDDGNITASVPSICKRLTPSFQLTDSLSIVYVDGVQQRSKRSRLRFEDPVTYFVTNPNHEVLTKVEDTSVNVDDENKVVTPVALTADMFSTNAPSNHGDELGNMLDGDLGTMFHSTWGTGIHPQLANDSPRYFDIFLPEALHYLQFGYNNRNDRSDRYSTLLRLYASNDSVEWKSVRDFELTADGLAVGAGARYDSPIIDLGGTYSYLRFEQISCSYEKNHMAWAEFSLSKVTYPSTTTESWEWTPLGRTYTVYIDWPQSRTVNVPRIDIDVEYGEMISSKDYYLEANVTIDGAGMFPDMPSTEVKIKGRGNTSWSNDPYAKNPYRLKFSSKQKPFGLKAGKNWVLLANQQTGSMTANAIGLKAARLMGSAGANHIIPVELYINGEYRGSYQFTEKVGFSNNSIEPEDETVAAFLELDSYYDETYKFKDSYYRLPVNIKEPDFSVPASTQISFSTIESDFNAFTSAVMDHADISGRCDVKALAAFYGTNELIGNLELMHPKSTYLYKENYQDPNSKYVFGPVWDLDWAFGYERHRTYFKEYATSAYTETKSMEKNSFWRDLRQCGEPLDKAFYRVWSKFMNNGGLDELIEYCDDYYAYAQPSFEHNATMWSDGNYYATITEDAKSWLRKRAQYVFSNQTVYDLSDEEEEEEPSEDETPITVRANNTTMVYGAGVPALTYTVEGGTLNGVPALTTTASSQSPVGTYSISVAKGTVQNNKVTYVPGTLTVKPASLTVRVEDATMVMGQDIPAFTITYKGFRNGDTEATALTTKPTATTTATKTSPAGTYPITVSGGYAKNYDLGYIGATLTITIPDGIVEVNLEHRLSNSHQWYDMNGRPVDPRHLTRGIYIVNGKKVVVK